MALDFVDDIKLANNEGRIYRAIVPCGPKQWYEPFAKMENFLFQVIVECEDSITVSEGRTKKVTLKFENKIKEQQWLIIKWNLPSEWTVSPCKEVFLNLDQYHGGTMLSEYNFEITPNNLSTGKIEALIEIKSQGRLSTLYIPVMFITTK